MVILLTFDFGVCYRGMITDSGLTVPVGQISQPGAASVVKY